MTERIVQVTFLQGRMFAAYLYLRGRVGQKSARTMPLDKGLLVIDYNAAGLPLGLEIDAPSTVSLQRLNEVLTQLGEPPLSDEESRSLQAAS